MSDWQSEADRRLGLDPKGMSQTVAPMTQADLDLLVEKWCRRLALRDWRLDVRLVRHWEIPDCAGQVCTNLNQKAAGIKILDPIDRGNPDNYYLDPPEQALIHELLHLHLEPFDPEDPKSLEFAAMEQAVAAMARGYYEMEQEIVALQTELAALTSGRHACEKGGQ